MPIATTVDPTRRAALLGREPHGRVRGRRARRTTATRSSSATPRCSTTARRCRRGTGWSARPRCCAVSRLEAAGGVRRAEAEVDPGALADAHARYAAERDAGVPADHAGPRPTGGVGGTRAGRQVPARPLRLAPRRRRRPGRALGRGAARRRGSTSTSAPSSTRARHAGRDLRHPRRSGDAAAPTELVDPDPPTPAQLTNAIGAVDRPRRRRAARASRRSSTPTTSTSAATRPWHLAAVERGATAGGRRASSRPRRRRGGLPHPGHRDRAPSALHNPGLDPASVSTPCSATCCVRRRGDAPAAARTASRSMRPASGADWCATRRSARTLPVAAAPLRPAGDAAPARRRRTSRSGARSAGATRPG